MYRRRFRGGGKFSWGRFCVKRKYIRVRLMRDSFGIGVRFRWDSLLGAVLCKKEICRRPFLGDNLDGQQCRVRRPITPPITSFLIRDRLCKEEIYMRKYMYMGVRFKGDSFEKFVLGGQFWGDTVSSPSADNAHNVQVHRPITPSVL